MDLLRNCPVVLFRHASKDGVAMEMLRFIDILSYCSDYDCNCLLYGEGVEVSVQHSRWRVAPFKAEARVARHQNRFASTANSNPIPFNPGSDRTSPSVKNSA